MLLYKYNPGLDESVVSLKLIRGYPCPTGMCTLGGSRMATQYRIIDGPSKWDLMQALFEPVSANRFVEFRVAGLSGKDSCCDRVSISEIAREDGSGESWNLAGNSPGGWYFHAYFSTKNRKGWIKFFRNFNEMRRDSVAYL